MECYVNKKVVSCKTNYKYETYGKNTLTLKMSVTNCSKQVEEKRFNSGTKRNHYLFARL